MRPKCGIYTCRVHWVCLGTCTQQDGKDIHGFETGSRFGITQKNPSPTKLGLPELFMVLKAAKKYASFFNRVKQLGFQPYHSTVYLRPYLHRCWLCMLCRVTNRQPAAVFVQLNFSAHKLCWSNSHSFTLRALEKNVFEVS